MIEVTQLTKHFKVALPGQGLGGKLKSFFAPAHKIVKAVDNISYSVRAGEIVGYLGPNGAGKSTTIKLLTGVLVPTGGSVTVNGITPYHDRRKNAYQIGVVYGQRSQLWWDLPLLDSFEILAAMYKVPQTRYKQNLEFLVDLLQMKDFLDQPVRRLSLGQRMKGDIVSALLHEPPLLYLDEPTIGLDVVAKNCILEFIQQLNTQKGTTVILTTHNLSDVERICPRIMIIDKGKVVLDDLRGAILNRFGRMKQLVVEFEEKIEPIQIPVGKVVKEEENKLTIEFDREQISAFDLIVSLKEHKGIADISIKEENIESIVTRIYEGER
ncbi:MAG: ATP-binding cassette domain-containing protein [Anaerolineales bacterium]